MHTTVHLWAHVFSVVGSPSNGARGSVWAVAPQFFCATDQFNINLFHICGVNASGINHTERYVFFFTGPESGG